MTFLLDTNAVSDLMRTDTRVEKWMSSLDEEDRIVICTIVRGEILFGISRLPEGRRRTALEQVGRQFLDAFHCEPVPEGASNFYAAIKLARYSQGLALDENDLWIAATALSLGAALVSRDRDFAGIVGLTVVALIT
jgi:predicted nucleic acid-binding protein